MFKTISALNSLLGTLLSLVIVAALGVGGWFAYHAYFADRWALEDTEKKLEEKEKELEERQKEVTRLAGQLASSQEQVESLGEELKAKEKEIARLSMANRLLKVDHRIARLDILWQGPSSQTGELMTRVSFVETDEQGKPLEKPRVFDIQGEFVRVDALVIKFADQHVEIGDPLRSTSVCLFKQIYGNEDAPKKGFPLDSASSRPAPYERGGKMSELEQEIWANFWDYANDAQKANKAGVRAAHGQSIFQQVRPNKRYKVFLRSTGDLTIVPEDRPPEETGQTF